MRYPIANNYIETLERVRRQLFEMAFTERHPEPLAYEEIQDMLGEVLRLHIIKLYEEAVNSESLRLYEIMFTDILNNPLVVNKTAQKRITILPYYPPGVTLVSDSGNNIALSWKDGRVIGTETDAEGKEIAKHEIISYLFDGDRITKRLLDEGRNADYILFFLSQLNQLQEAIFERWEDVRILFHFIENQHLQKYKNVNPVKNPNAFISLLEKEGKEKPETWKAKATSPIVTATHDEIMLAGEKYLHINLDNSIEPDKRYKALLSYLSPGGVSKGFKGCLREGVDSETLERALRGCVLKEISNSNRIDVLYCAFCVYAKHCIYEGSRKKYIENLDRQILEMNLKSNKGKKPEIEQKIENIFK